MSNNMNEGDDVNAGDDMNAGDDRPQDKEYHIEII